MFALGAHPLLKQLLHYVSQREALKIISTPPTWFLLVPYWTLKTTELSNFHVASIFIEFLSDTLKFQWQTHTPNTLENVYEFQ